MMPDHHPPHLYLDDTWSMLSARTADQARFLRSAEAKTLLRDKMVDLVQKLKMELKAWVILDNHYHNPAKHGYVRDPADWPFSSYHCYLRTRGREWLDDCLARYPVISYLEDDDWE